MTVRRRELLLGSAALLASACAPRTVRAPRSPKLDLGVQIGEVTSEGCIVWSRADRPGRLEVEWSRSPGFQRSTRVAGAHVGPNTDGTGHVDLTGLPPEAEVFLRVYARGPGGRAGDAIDASFRTSSVLAREDVVFAWSGDTCGQGFGIDLSRGGLTTYGALRLAAPHFFVHCGDLIYADQPIESTLALTDGTVWQNLVTEAKSHVAETLQDFRGNFAYPLLDAHVQAFHREVPTYVTWDDHDVHDNWWPDAELLDSRYTRAKGMGDLVSRARQALFEYQPLRSRTSGRLFRAFTRGPHLDLFLLDARSFRGSNLAADARVRSADTDMLGRSQLEWLKQGLLRSTATWKVIATSSPIGILVPDRSPGADGWADGSNELAGRELELAELLAFVRAQQIRNVVFLTADVHYAAAHHFHPERAHFREFDPFWEFVAGPLHGGTFGPNLLDDTFGPQVRFVRAAPPGTANLPPSAGYQSFGMIRIDGGSGLLTASLHDGAGTMLWTQDLEPEADSPPPAAP